MANLAFTEAFRTHEFVVEIEGIESPGVTKVSGLSDGEIDTIEQPDGGSHFVHKISSGIIKYGDITIERNMDGSKADADFKKWFDEMFKIDGSGLGSNKNRRNGSVIKKQNGCMPPGQAKKWARGRPLGADISYYDLPSELLVRLPPPPHNHRYVRVAGDVLMIAIGTNMVVDALGDLMR